MTERWRSGKDLPRRTESVCGGGKGRQQLVSLRVGPAAVVEGTAGSQKGSEVPVCGEFHLTIIEIKLSGGQGGSILRPRQGVDRNRNACGCKFLGNLLCGRNLEAVFLIDQ